MDDAGLIGLCDGCTNAERQLTAQYLEELRTIPDGWKVCLTDFLEKVHPDDNVRFFCLQVLEYHIRYRHSVCSDDDVLLLRNAEMSWFQPHSDGFVDKSFVLNKMAQVIALTFVVDYPTKWPHFFTDILNAVNSCNVAYTIDLYLRVLLAIDQEIVDRDIIHTQEENARNTLIKDHMRDTCVSDLVQHWFEILKWYEGRNNALVCQIMEVIGAYVTWIEISLIANEKLISVLLRYLTERSLRESAADCIYDIVSKGMEPVSKVKLVESLVTVLQSVGVLSLMPPDTSDVNADFLAKMSKLLNGIGVALISSYNKFLKAGDKNNAQSTFELIEGKVPHLLRYLSDEDDGISEPVIPFATQYISILKSKTNHTSASKDFLQAILGVVINKMAYDESYNFYQQGEDEAVFQEYRNNLKTLFDNILHLDRELAVKTVKEFLEQTLQSLNDVPFITVELSMLLLLLVGDANTEKFYGSAAEQKSPFHEMMLQVVSSQVSNHHHSVVILQYFEVIVRYEKFFSSVTGAQCIPAVMSSFLDQRGLRHESPAVRSRVCYLFVRFVKSLRNNLASIAEEALGNLHQLLVMIPGNPKYNGYITPNDLNFLYEAAGYFVVYSNRVPEDKRELMNMLLVPLLESFNALLPELYVATTAQQQEEIAQTLYCILSYASRTSKVFPNPQTARQNGCLECFTEVLPTVLKGLEGSIQKDVLQSGVRQYLHRMILCLGDELLKYVPLAVTLLLKDCQSHDIQEFIPLINQLITKYKSRIAPFLEEIFAPVVQTICAYLNKPFDPQDTEEYRDKANLQKAYFLFIFSLSTNNVTSVIANQGPESLSNVLQTVIDGAKTSPDGSVRKLCFGCLKKFVESWGGEETIDGFITFTYKDVVPACFETPLQKEFDMEDAQFYLSLGEITGLLIALVKHRGSELLLFLQNQYLPLIPIPQELIQELLAHLQKADHKTLKIYLKAFFTNMRTILQTQIAP